MHPKKKAWLQPPGRAEASKLPITLRLLPRYLFSDSWKLILQGDSPGGLSPEGLSSPTRIRFLWEILFRLCVFAEGTSFRNFPAHSRTETKSVGYWSGIIFSFLTFLSRSWLNRLKLFDAKRYFIAIVYFILKMILEISGFHKKLFHSWEFIVDKTWLYYRN